MLQPEPQSFPDIILMNQAGPRASSVPHMWPAGPREVRLPAGEVHVWCARLDASQEQIQSSWQMLSCDERERAERFRFPSDRLHFLAARVILRTLAGRYLEIAGSALRFRYGPFGKPVLHDCHASDLRFNMAHSGGVAVYAFTRSREVGLDLEAEQSARLSEGVPDLSFTTSERQAVAALPPDRRRLAMLTLWTRKEAYLKALGCGLQQDLNSFEVSVPPTPPALLRVPDEHTGGTGWFLHDLQPAEGFVGTLCLENEAEVMAWSWSEG